MATAHRAEAVEDAKRRKYAKGKGRKGKRAGKHSPSPALGYVRNVCELELGGSGWIGLTTGKTGRHAMPHGMGFLPNDADAFGPMRNRAAGHHSSHTGRDSVDFLRDFV